MEGWILEYAATFRNKTILASYANGRKLSRLGCPQLPLMCAFLSSAVEKEEYEYYEKVIDVLWELYKIIPHLLPFQEFGNLIIDIKIQKISLTMRGMADENYSKLAEEIARLFKVPEGRNFQNEEDFVWFNRKAKEVSEKMIKFVNDGKGNYEMLFSFSQDIKKRVFEYVEKVNKKIGLTFLELFSRFSEHSQCKTKCELKKEVSHMSKKIKNPADNKGSSMAQTSATDEKLLCSEPVHCNHGDINDEPSCDNSCNNQCQLSTDNLNKVPCLNYSSNEPSSDTSEDLLVLYKAAAIQTNIQENSPKLLCGTHSTKDGASNSNKFSPDAASSVMTENACAKSEKEPKSGRLVAAAGLGRNILKIPARRTHQMISSQSDEERHTQSDCKRIKISHHESPSKGRMNSSVSYCPTPYLCVLPPAGNGEYSEDFSESKRHCQCPKTSSFVAVTNHMSSPTLLNTRQSISEKNPPVIQENVHEAIARNVVPFKVKMEPQESDGFLWKPSTNPDSQNKTSVKREASLIPRNECEFPVVPHVSSRKLEKSDERYGNNHRDISGNGIMKVCEVPITSSQAILPGNNNGKCTCDVYCQTSLASSESESSSSSDDDDDELSSSLYSSTSEDLLLQPRENSPKLSRTRSWKDVANNLHKLDRGAAASVMAENVRAESEKETGRNIKKSPPRTTRQMVSSQSDIERHTASNRKRISHFKSIIVLGEPERRLPLKGYGSDEMTDCAIENKKSRKRNVFPESDDPLSDTCYISDSDSHLSISSEISTTEEKQNNEPGSIAREKVGFSWRNSENRDFRHKRNSDDHLSESTSDEDYFPELNKRCYVVSPRKNRHRSSRFSLAMRNLKRISRNKRLGKIELLDCVVMLEKVKMSHFFQ